MAESLPHKDMHVDALHEELSASNMKENAVHTNHHGIDTSAVMPGADAAYEAKVTIMNEALLDIGMNSFQWKVFITTGFGWFVDNVSTRLMRHWCRIMSRHIEANTCQVLAASYYYHISTCEARVQRSTHRLSYCCEICRPGRGIDNVAHDCRLHRSTTSLQHYSSYIFHGCAGWCRRAQFCCHRCLLCVHRLWNRRESASGQCYLS